MKYFYNICRPKQETYLFINVIKEDEIVFKKKKKKEKKYQVCFWNFCNKDSISSLGIRWKFSSRLIFF